MDASPSKELQSLPFSDRLHAIHLPLNRESLRTRRRSRRLTPTLLCIAGLTWAILGAGPTAHADQASWWAFERLNRPPIPDTGSAWVINPIDQFIFSRLAEKGLGPRPLASNLTRLRRVSFALRGLPPDSREVRQFASPIRARDYGALVDAFLQTHAFGERWARIWFDVVRFAESSGFEMDHDRPDAWRYRDFVINAMNRDQPFDEFVRWQLAGDQLEPTNPEAHMATGFLVAGVENLIQSRKDFVPQRYDKIDEMLSTTTTSFLGLSVGCARCHDHKHDPITQLEYYQLAAAFEGTVSHQLSLPASDGALTIFAATEVINGRIPMVVVSEPSFRNLPSIEATMRFLERGDPNRPRQVVSLAFPGVLTSRSLEPPPHRHSGENGRAALARWITDTPHGAGPLLARVIVNRLWQGYFGRGIVATPNDFGRHGEEPTHPDLLEWLASELIRHQWRLKPIHRLIATSATFQQAYDSAATNPSLESHQRVDPHNRLHWRRSPRRLEAEAIRDSLLQVSGQLDRALHGPSEPDPNAPRRSVYLRVKRSKRIPLLQLFDAPDALQPLGTRPATATAPQGLALLNSPFVDSLVHAFTDRVLHASGPGPEDRIHQAYVWALGRPPTPAERAIGTPFFNAGSLELVRDFCQALLCLNEFLYVE